MEPMKNYLELIDIVRPDSMKMWIDYSRGYATGALSAIQMAAHRDERLTEDELKQIDHLITEARWGK